MAHSTVEHERLRDPAPWKRWGPYVAERAWGTVREDYSADGRPWEYFPHDHARSRAFRWNEDGLAGVCDDQQRLCLAFSFWNGRDPFLKERIYGLTTNEGNHGEDAKEYWWHVDSTPTHSWMEWRYLYPHEAFPYDALLHENKRRNRDQPEFELIETGVLDRSRWVINIEYAKSAPDDLSARITVTNRSPGVATLHVLPTLWFRNTWSWGLDDRRPSIRVENGRFLAEHHSLGVMELSGTGEPELLVCDNESNSALLWDQPGPSYPKDGISDHVVTGAPTVNPDGIGTKGALWYRLEVDPQESASIVVRLSADGGQPPGDELFTRRRADADEFYTSLSPDGAAAEKLAVMRQAFAGMLWSKQFYHFDVDRWLEGDSAQPSPPAERRRRRNSGWRHLDNADIIAMPDTWEYPWYAAWDLAFHTVPLAHVDPDFAKAQLELVLREWYMHPNGQLPAYEWSFGDVNPPVHAWAALRVFEIDGSTDFDFLQRVLHKLLINFTWWVNRKDADNNNVFEGGFLGLDNIGPFDRSEGVPAGVRLEQADGTAWMAMYCLNLLEMAIILADHDDTYEDLATKFFEHFTYVASAINNQGLWSEKDGFYHDVLRTADGPVPLEVRSMVGLIPLFAVTFLDDAVLDHLPGFAARMNWFLEHKPQFATDVVQATPTSAIGAPGHLLSVVPAARLRRVLGVMLDEAEFLSEFGIRSLSARHRDEPYVLDIAGSRSTVSYQPAESRSPLFGGNSNWRGPVWFPVNYLIIEALRRYARFFGDSEVAGPGRGPLLAVARDLAARVTSLFLRDEDGRRPVHGQHRFFDEDPDVGALVAFHEYFHGDTGAGLGASHQTGWTGLVADLIACGEVEQ